MPEFNPIQTNFTAGELSERVAGGRVDIARYNNGCRRLRNMIVMPQGGVYRRHGFRHVNEVKDSTKTCVLAEFEYSTTQAYVFEMGPGYGRIFLNKGRLNIPEVTAAITNGDFADGTTNWTDASVAPGTRAVSGGKLRLATGSPAGGTGKAYQQVTINQLNTVHVLRFKLDRDQQGSDGALVFSIGTTAGGSEIVSRTIEEAGFHTIEFTPAVSPVYVSFGITNGPDRYLYIDDVDILSGAIFEFKHPYAENHLLDLQYIQSADVLYITHPSYPPYKLQRYGARTWSMGRINFIDGPYLAKNTTSTTVGLSATSGPAVTATASKGIFSPTDVGRLFRIEAASGSPRNAWGRITAYTSATQVTLELIGPAAATTAVTGWRFGAWSDTTGWPEVASFYEERLVFGNNRNMPSTLWLSRSGSYEDMTPSALSDNVVVDSNALVYTPASNSVNAIRWLSAAASLLFGTAKTEFQMRGSGSNEGITPTSVRCTVQTGYGSKKVTALRIGNATIFVQRSGRKIYEMIYDINSNIADAFTANEISLLADHLYRAGRFVRNMKYQHSPEPVIWILMEEGQLVGVSYMRDQQIVGHHVQEIGGNDVYVNSIAVIPTSDELSDELWVLVERTINGTTKQYIEVLEQPHEPTDNRDKDGMRYLDSFLELDNRINATLTPGAGADTVNSTVTFTAGSSVFVVGDVGRIIHYRWIDANGVRQNSRARITSYISGTEVSAKILSAFPSLDPIVANGWHMSVTTLSGFTHLANQTVRAFGDGADLGDVTVDGSGNITLPRPVSIVAAGYNFRSLITTLPPEGGAAKGTAIGKKKRVHKTTAKVLNTMTFKYGNMDDLLIKTFQQQGDPMDNTPPLYSGDVELNLDTGVDTEGVYSIVQDKPYPLVVTCLMPELVVHG